MTDTDYNYKKLLSVLILIMVYAKTEPNLPFP